MGWNSWNTFHCGVTSDLLRQTADLFVSLGLDKAGYEYINTDDCWSNLARDASGRLVPGPSFPGGDEGMKGLASYIQSKGLKFGIYGAAGLTTCAGRAGSLYHERVDAETFAGWGVDYLKYDNCGENTLQSYAKFTAMRDALNATGRRIFFSFEPHSGAPIGWPALAGNSWRSGGDIRPSFESIMQNAVTNNAWSGVGRPGGFPSADMLEVGVGGVTQGESRAHFALWCVTKSPLLIGADLRTLSKPFLDILRNADLIAISQDPLGVPGILAHSAPGPQPSDRIPGVKGAGTGADAAVGAPWSELPSPRGLPAQRGPPAGPARASFGLVTDCAIPELGSAAPAPQLWAVDAASGTIRQGASCLTVDSAEAVPGRGSLTVVLRPCQAASKWQQWTGLEVINATLGQVRLAANLSGPPGAVWFQGPTEGLAEPSGANRRCGSCCGANDTTSAMCNGTTADGRLSIGLDDMRYRCAVDPHCAGFSLDTTEGSYFRPVTAVASIEDDWGRDDEKWRTWQARTGAAQAGWCLATNESAVLFLEACEEEPERCRSSRCYTSRLRRQQWYAPRSGQLLSSLTTVPVSPLGSGPVNVPQCLSSQPNAAPPPPPPAPPSVDASLPLQVWAAPLSGGRVAAVLLNAGSVNATVTATWSTLGLTQGQNVSVRDAMHGKDLGTSQGPLAVAVATHDAAAFILTPQ